MQNGIPRIMSMLCYGGCASSAARTKWKAEDVAMEMRES